jgi:microcompartment protein CcmL/EutN
MGPAIALIEFDSIVQGILAGDAMVKRAPIAFLRTGTVQRGKYLVLVGGDTASVEESLQAGLDVGGEGVVDKVYLPHVHPTVFEAVQGSRQVGAYESLGVIETSTVASIIQAADAAVKGAEVTLLEIRLANGMAGKGLALVTGEVADVEAAISIGTSVIQKQGLWMRSIVIPSLHGEMEANIAAGTRFELHEQPRA